METNESFSPAARRDRDARILSLAAAQHGVVSRNQLLTAGVPAHDIDHRARDGRFERLYRGVYRVPGPVAGPREREMAAVLACGDGAVLSHGSATLLWPALAPAGAAARAAGEAAAEAGRSGRPPVEVSVVGRFLTPGPGVRVHRVGVLERAHWTVVDGIPVTTAARTIVDLAATASVHELEQALAAAEREELATREDVARVLVTQRCRAGVAILRRLIGSGRVPAYTRSEAEVLFLALVRRAGLPEPKTNVWLRAMQVDFLWRSQRLVVEVDGYAFHNSHQAFERDRRRDRILTGAGFRVIRVTWSQLNDEPDKVLVSLVQALMNGSLVT